MSSLEEAELDLERGLVGDDWYARGSRSMSDGSSNPGAQLTLANARAVDLVAAGDRERWALAGDQFYVDFDISGANLPAGTRLALGTAVIEVTELPHDGCVKSSARFGNAAHRFVNTKEHRHLNLRGSTHESSSRAPFGAATRSASCPRRASQPRAPLRWAGEKGRVRVPRYGPPRAARRCVLSGVKTATAGLLVDYSATATRCRRWVSATRSSTTRAATSR